MPNTNSNSTVIEMPERGRAEAPGWRAVGVHATRGAQSSPSRGDSPSPSRGGMAQPSMTTTTNGHLDVPHPTIVQPNLTRNRRDTSNDRNGDHLQPLLEADANKPKPPIAGPEIDEDSDDNHRVAATPDHHPGIDDGFFHPNGEQDAPGFESRFGEDDPKTVKPAADDGEHHPNKDGDEVDGVHGIGGRSTPNGFNTRFKPESPFPMPELIPVDARITPDVNVYQQKKNLAQGMMDLALLSANANQLRYVLEAGSNHPYYMASLIFISASLILQIGVGVGLLMNSRYNVKEHDDICKADRINDFTVLGIFLITIVNVFVASFGVAVSPNTTIVEPKV